MSRRKTRCLLVQAGSEALRAPGVIVCFAVEDGICGRRARDGEESADWPDADCAADVGDRPPGVCPRCWAVWRRDVLRGVAASGAAPCCYLCHGATDGTPHPECEAEARRLDLHGHLHAEDLPGCMADLDQLDADCRPDFIPPESRCGADGVSPEYRAWRKRQMDAAAKAGEGVTPCEP